MEKTAQYTHQKLGEPVISIAGSYVIGKEERLSFGGREVLYLVGVGLFNTACCGAGGAAYAAVPGFIIEWKTEKDAEGKPVSLVERISSPEQQNELSRLIRIAEKVGQVTFL